MRSHYLWVSVAALGCAGALGCTGAVTGNSDNGSGSAATGNGSSSGGLGSANGGQGSSTGGAGSTVPNAGASGTGQQMMGPVTGSEINTEPTWRLSNAEYVNSVHDLLGITLTTPLDPDGAAAGFSAGLVAGDATVRAYHAAAIEASGQTAALLKLVPCDAATITATPAVCAGKFIDAVAPLAFRRPLDAATRAGLVALFGTVNTQFGFNAGLQGLVEQMLQSPYFLYHLELEEQAKGPGQVAVTGYSMASRLSYLIWASMPDTASFTKAAAGQLSTPAQVATEAARMLADPKAKSGLRNFYEQWLEARYMPTTKGGTFAATFDPVSILGSFDAQVDAALWAPTGGLTTLLTGTQAYVNAATAPLFGVTATGNSFQPVAVDPTQRLGILMHPAIMSTFATETGSHPIKRGVFVWDQIVCQNLPDPPANVPAFTGVPPGSSVRTAYEVFTAPPLCQACHVRINPVGFLFENYDTVGKYRTIDDNGQPVNSQVTVVQAQDASGNPDAVLNVATPNAVQFAKNLAADPTVVTQCLVKQLYRYALKRVENDADTNTLSGLDTSYTAASQNLSTLISGLAQTPGFLNRLNVQ
jgi:hypothetical protein